MLTAYGRVIRTQRRLERLAPSFFDAAVVERERENRAEQRRWMAFWEPAIAKAYGADHKPAVDRVARPPLPPPHIQRAVDRRLAELQLWLEVAHAAMERHRQRRPHALPTLTQLARLLELAFDLKKMFLGLDPKNPLPQKITYDYEFTDLKRAYGHLLAPAPPAAASDKAIASGAAQTTPSPSAAPPVQNDCPLLQFCHPPPCPKPNRAVVMLGAVGPDNYDSAGDSFMDAQLKNHRHNRFGWQAKKATTNGIFRPKKPEVSHCGNG